MKSNIFLSMCFVGTLILSSCNKEQINVTTLDESETSLIKKSHFVTLDEALRIADLQKNPYAKGSKISEYLEFKKKGDLPEFYIINYPNSGFIIISAEDRLTPILAYSATSNFPLCDSNTPWGVTDWLNSISEIVDSVRNTSMEQDSIAKYKWKSVLSGKHPVFDPILTATKTDYSSVVWEWGEDADQDDCGWEGHIIARYYYYVPELLRTVWG